jgi:hypothetical protein
LLHNAALLSGSRPSRSYVIFGKAAGSWPVAATSVTTAINAGAGGFEVDGAVSGQDYGFSVASGDLNGDGVADLLIGGYGANSTNGGFAVVFGGQASRTTAPAPSPGPPRPSPSAPHS